MFGVRVSPFNCASNDWGIAGRPGGMVTCGAGGSLTGRGANLLIIDDLIKNSEEALSPTVREKHWDWWLSTASTRVEPNGGVLLIMTRWHPEDLAGKLLLQSPDEWKVVSLPALATHDDPMGREEGEALWPDRWPADVLNQVRRNSDPYWWNAMYQQNPSRHGRFEWPDEYFQDIWCDAPVLSV